MIARGSRWRSLCPAAGLTLGVACGSVDADPAGISQALIYGADDRIEVYAESDKRVRAAAVLSVAAVIPTANVQRNVAGRAVIDALTLGQADDVCEGEAFLDQPSAAVCSAVLIAPDLVLSAGHCFADAAACAGRSIVFDFYFKDAYELEHLTQADLYTCKRVVARLSRSSEQPADAVLVQLDRRAADRKPIAMRDGDPKTGEALIVIGTPAGLPLKIDHGAHVADDTRLSLGVFGLDSDTFEGSSGSAVLDAEGKLLGIVTRGAPDYMMDVEAGCAVVRRLPADRALSGVEWGEVATASGSALQTFCAGGDLPGELCPSEEEACAEADCAEAGSVCGEGDASDCALDAGTALDASEQDSGAASSPRRGGCAIGRPPGHRAGLVAALLGASLLAYRRRNRQL